MKPPAVYPVGISLMFCVTTVLSVDLQMKISAPLSIKVGETGTLNVHCSFTGSARDIPLKFIELKSKKVSGNTKILANINPEGLPSIVSNDLKQRAQISGALHSGPVSSSFLRLEIGNMSCVDATTYTCSSEYENATTGPQLLEASAVVNGKSDPSELEFISTPIKEKYPINSQVKIMCKGKIGKPVKEWFWYKYDSESKLWHPIRDINIVQSEPAQVSDCAFLRHSNYTFTIPDDDVHKFRCTVGHDVDDSLFITLR